MAKKPETLEHSVFGSLTWDSKSGWWFTAYRLPSGAHLDVIIDPSDGDRYEFIEPAAALFQWALNNERRILHRAMKAELLELYNDTWRLDDPELSEKELTARLAWHLLVVSASEIVPVEFSYGAEELFGNHSVAIEVDARKRFRDIDLRG
jgi:hypothetical protein